MVLRMVYPKAGLLENLLAMSTVETMVLQLGYKMVE